MANKFKQNRDAKAGGQLNQTDIMEKQHNAPERAPQFDAETQKQTDAATADLAAQLDAPVKTDEQPAPVETVETAPTQTPASNVDESTGEVIEDGAPYEGLASRGLAYDENDMEFETVSNNFEFLKLKDGESFTGIFKGLDASVLHPKIENGMVFHQIKTNRVFVVSKNYQLVKYFEEHGETGRVYRLTRVCEKPAERGKVIVWNIEAAKPKS